MRKFRQWKNKDKIECVKLANSEGSFKAMEKYQISDQTLLTWRKQHSEGLYKGREHLTTIAYTKNSDGKTPLISHAQGLSKMAISSLEMENTHLKNENENLKAALRKLLNIESL